MPFTVDVSAVGLGIAVSWNPNPATDEVSQYSVQAQPKSTNAVAGCTPKSVTATAPGSDSRLVVAGLCAQVAYTARIRATNTVGTSSWSGLSAPVAPLTARPTSAPVITSLVPRDGQVIVSWAAPTDTGGSSLSGYTVTATAAGTPAVTVNVAATATTATPAGLVNGTAYAIAVTATNTVGPSQPGTGTATPTAAYAPTAPAGVTATPDGTGNVAVSWAAPSDDGGSAVTGYTITWQQNTYTAANGWVATAGATVHTRPVTGQTASLTAADFETQTAFYGITVTATTAVGPGTPGTAAAPVTPTVTTAAVTVVLTDATLAGLAAVTATALTWNTATTSQVSTLKVNQVLVAGFSTATPNGFIRKVTRVTRRGAATTATTSDAPLSSVITTGALAASTNPASATAPGGSSGKAGPAPRFEPALPGIQARPNASAGYSTTKTFGIDTKIGPVKITGGLTVTPSISLDVNFTTGFAGIPNGVRLTAVGKVTATTQLVASLGSSFDKKIGDLTGTPISFTIGPVPIVVVPRMPIYLSGDGKVSVGASASMTIGTQLDWTSTDPGSLKTKNISAPLTLSGGAIPGLIATATGSLSLKFEPTAALYGIGGPSFGAELKLSANLNANPAPGQNFLTITATLTLSAGLAIDILKFHGDLSYHAPAITLKTFTLSRAPSASWTVGPLGAKVNVGSTLQMTATRSDGATPATTWTILGGVAGDTISNTGQLKPAAPAGRTLTVMVSDTSGASGQGAVAVGTPFDPPGNVQARQHADDLSATITWTAPTDTGGKPLAGYTVITTPDTGTHTLPAGTTSLELSNLTPGTNSVSVYATNTARLNSPPRTTAFAVVPLCTMDWQGPSGGNWGTVANWAQRRLPGNSDYVCLNGGTIANAPTAVIAGLNTSGANLSITRSATLTVTGYATAAGGVISGAGVLILAAGSLSDLSRAVLANSGGVVNRGTITANAVVNTCVGYNFNGICLVGSTLTNAGSVTLTDGAGIGMVDNADLINNAGASITTTDDGSYITGINPADRSFTNNGTVNAGRALTISHLQLTSGGILHGPVTITRLTVPADASLQIDQTVTIGTVDGPGQLTIPAGASVDLSRAVLANSGGVVNRGTITANAVVNTCVGYNFNGICLVGSTLTNAGSVTLTDGAGIGMVDNADLINNAGATINTSDGTEIGGLSTPDPTLTNNGTINAAAGQLRVRALRLGSTSTLEISVDGSGSANLQVDSSFLRRGALKISTSPGFNPAVGDLRTLISGTGMTGTFSKVQGVTVGANHWQVQYSATTVTVTCRAGAV